jgi:death-on-curing protein
VTDYLTLADILAIHADLIERYGGSPGLRDAGLLEAALFRPQTGYYTDLIEEAAALWESLAQNHAFVDGNKRIAFAATYTFLAINGVDLRASSDEAYSFINGLYETGSFRFEELATWLRSHTTKA